MRKKIISMILMISFGLLVGCASIVHGTKQDEMFLSEPTGAEILIDNMAQGTTPKTLPLKRSLDHTVTIKLAGYQPATFKLTRGISGWVFGNVLFGGVIGIVVDAADGAIYHLKPDQFNLASGEQVELGKKDSITVILRKHVQGRNQLHKVGQLKRAH